MFNNTPNWTPFKIPSTPTITNDDVYSLTCSNGANSSKNPSQFLQWRKVGLPEGDNKGDLLQWDPAAGDDGAWVVLAAPSNEGSLIYWDGSNWQYLTPPSNEGSLIYWDGSNWQYLTPPSGNVLHVLGIRSRTLTWTATEDCP